MSRGKYVGIANESNIISLKVLDECGRGSSVDVLAGLQWVVDNKDLYNIRVVNLSVGTPDMGSYDPLVRAVEKAWDLGLVITVAAGNNGPKNATVTSPGISRKVITVGSSDDCDPVQIWGNSLVDFSGRGPTSECIVKPDILAPGTNIVSCLCPTINKQKLDNNDHKIIGNHYLCLSGTSMSTPMVSGAIALLLQKYPLLSPDDVKYMLKLSATNLNCSSNQQGWGLLNIEKFVSLEANYVRKKDMRNCTNDSK